MKMHERIHDKLKPLACSKCLNNFSRRYKLSFHVKNMHWQKNTRIVTINYVNTVENLLLVIMLFEIVTF